MAKNQKGRCLFCGRWRELSNEHLFSAPIIECLGAQGPFEVEIVRVRDGVTTQVASYESDTASAFKRKAYCKSCNGGWMQVMDKAVAPILRPMIRGHFTFLDPHQQHLCAIWMTKIALVVESLAPADRLIPDATFHAFYDDPQPVGREPIQLAHYLDTRSTKIRVTPWRRVMRLHRIGPDEHIITIEAVVVTVVLGHLIFQAAIPHPERFLGAPTTKNGDQRITIRPPSERLVFWPPLKKVTPASLEAFTDPNTPPPTP